MWVHLVHIRGGLDLLAGRQKAALGKEPHEAPWREAVDRTAVALRRRPAGPAEGHHTDREVLVAPVADRDIAVPAEDNTPWVPMQLLIEFTWRMRGS